MVRFLFVLLLCTLTLLSGPKVASTVAGLSPEPSSPAGVFDPTWAQAALWDDGQAEVALYEARRPQYGKIETYEAVLIVVKEDFNQQLYVKADPPFEVKRLLPVLKLNAVHSYWTANYPYHFLASVFVRRDNPAALVKLTVGSQEWCGNTFKEVKTWTKPAELVYHTYFDGEGDGSQALVLRPGDLFEDQLPLALRSLRFAPGLEVRTRLLPSLISNRVPGALDFFPADIRVEAEEPVVTPQARIQAWRIALHTTGLQQTYWFASSPPHELLKMESSDGRSLALKALARKPYWKIPTYQPAM